MVRLFVMSDLLTFMAQLAGTALLVTYDELQRIGQKVRPSTSVRLDLPASKLGSIGHHRRSMRPSYYSLFIRGGLCHVWASLVSEATCHRKYRIPADFKLHSACHQATQKSV